MGIIYISHHLEEVFKIGDRVTVLRDGCKVGIDLNGLTKTTLIKDMVGRDPSTFYQREKRCPLWVERSLQQAPFVVVVRRANLFDS